MPPTLHPRSRATSSLFTTTLLLSFLVVGAPHVIPCPVDHRRVSLADGEDPNAAARQGRARRRRERRRECPVPKPGGFVGQMMGFERRDRGDVLVVKVERFTGRIPPRKDAEAEGGR